MLLPLALALSLLSSGLNSTKTIRSDLTYRWFMLTANLRQPPEVDKAIKAIVSAGSAGYNGVVFKDPTLDELTKLPVSYITALNQVMAEAKKANIEFIPSIAPIGNAGSLLASNSTLAESAPYHNVHFIVNAGHLKPADPLPAIVNGGFDTFAADLPTGFRAAPHPGVLAAMDAAMKHGGAAALRIEGQPTTQPGNSVTYIQTVQVKPYHQYRLGVWTKGTTTSGSQVNLIPVSPTGDILGYSVWQDTLDWSKSVVVFDSLENYQIDIQLEIKPTPTAKIWFDDLTIEDAGVLNITRREDCPVTIRSDDGAIFNEEVDIDDIKDVFLPPGSAYARPDIFHDATPPALLGNSRLHENQVVLLDYYAAILVDNTPTLCISDSQSKKLIKNEVKRIFTIIHPKTIFFDIDQVKALGWDTACEATGSSAGTMLTNFLRDQASTLKALDPNVQMATFTNMFDPTDNGKDIYYLAKGGCATSLRGLPNNLLFLNKNASGGVNSLSNFARQGFSQVLMGSTDVNANPLPIDKWQKTASGIAGVKGFCYFTSTGDYSHLAEFAKLASKPNP